VKEERHPGLSGIFFFSSIEKAAGIASATLGFFDSRSVGKEKNYHDCLKQ